VRIKTGREMADLLHVVRGGQLDVYEKIKCGDELLEVFLADFKLESD